MPLSKIVIKLYPIILEVGLWVLLLAALIGGWSAGGFFGAILSVIVGGVITALFVGALLVLNEINARVKSIEASKGVD